MGVATRERRRALGAMAAAWESFQAAYPSYAATTHLDALRAREYARLDQGGHVYLDYTGGGLHAASQVERHMALLNREVFGNPHSRNPTSQAMTSLVEEAREAVRRYFKASSELYEVIFTANASGALKLVGEAYPFEAGDHYLLTFDNHNSVNGIREFARARGARVTYIPVCPPDLRLHEARLTQALGEARPGGNNLFAYPAQSNFSGTQHDLAWIERAQAAGWDVLVDCAAFAPTNPLDLSQWHPDFVPLSFYKMFGYPTGVGCLLARRTALAKLRRPWFAGGTISVASVRADGFFQAEGAAGFEDGTLNYLSLPAVAIGLDHLTQVGIEAVHERVMCLTGWLLDSLATLRHGNGAPLIRVFGPVGAEGRGSTLALNFYDAQGQLIDYRTVESRANAQGISLRTGRFCNPGVDEVAHGLADAEAALRDETRMSFDEFLVVMDRRSAGAVRVSLGIASNFEDVYRFLTFAQTFLDATDVGPRQGSMAFCRQ